MLRHYDEIGLLKPVYVDDFTSYRYYDERQLPIANRIQSLKGMGLSLPIIKQILSDYSDTTSLKTYLELQKSQKIEDLQALQNQISLIENAINELDYSEQPKNCDIAIKEIPKRNVISCRKKLSWYSEEGELWELLHSETEELNIKFTNPNYNIAIIYENCEDDNVDVEVQCSVIGVYPNTEHTKFKRIPSTLVASLTCEGDYLNLPSINNKLSQWILANGYELCGHIMNIYHISPKSEYKKENLLTEVCFPIRKK